MTYGAYGLVEVVGEANAILVTDRMLKTSEVEYVTRLRSAADMPSYSSAAMWRLLKRLWMP